MFWGRICIKFSAKEDHISNNLPSGVWVLNFDIPKHKYIYIYSVQKLSNKQIRVYTENKESVGKVDASEKKTNKYWKYEHMEAGANHYHYQ